MRMKPVPKAILVLLVVGAAGYGINFYLNKNPSVLQTTKSEPVEQAQPVQARPTEQPEPEQQPKQQSANDRGLEALLGKK